MRRDPRLLAVPVVVALVAVTWIASAAAPKQTRTIVAQSSVLPIRHTDLVCPQVGGAIAGGAGRIAYANAASSDDIDSILTAQSLGPDSTPQAIPVQPGHAWVVDGPTSPGPFQVSVNGSLTDSLSAVQFNRSAVGSALQASAMQCEGPTTDAWFAGFSSEVGAHATMLLSNVDTVPATVDVSIWGGGNGEPNAKRGIKVDAQTQVVVSLDQIEPGLTVGAAHVVATAGRVVPAVRYDAQNGSLPLGVDWLPRTAPAATTQTVPGILGGLGSRRLIIANPGNIAATVSLNVITEDGSFDPTDFAALTVDAGAVTAVDLDPVLQGSAAAVVVSSSDPVVAAGESALPLTASGASDFAFTGAVSALSGPTVIAGGEVAPSRHTQLLLTASGQQDANVIVEALPGVPASSPLRSPLTIPAGTTMVFDLGSMTADPAPGVVVTPEPGGPVYAAWSLQETGKDSSDLTELVMQTPPRIRLRPPSHFDPAVGLP
ncbi:MAG: hypothetical protein QOG69_1515 [Actinomycetota bacterium]|nr:hypothetical protein [Actinomycetota bacterium]